MYHLERGAEMKFLIKRNDIIKKSSKELQRILSAPEAETELYSLQFAYLELYKRGEVPLIENSGCDSESELLKNSYDVLVSDSYYKSGYEEYRKFNFEKAYENFKIAADSGNMLASTMLGIMEIWNLCEKNDYNDAKERFENALKQNFPLAALGLCEVYLRGYAGRKDEHKAEELLNKYRLSIEKMCEAGNYECQYLYSIMILNTECMPDREDLGLRLMLNAADNLNVFAQIDIAQFKVRQTFFRDEVESGLKELEEICTVSEISLAEYLLGVDYLNLEAPYCDIHKGYSYICKAVHRGNVEAIAILAGLYNKGLAVKKDVNKSVELYNKVLEKSDSGLANFYLGLIYYNGELGKKNIRLAMNYFLYAVADLPELAYYYIGEIYMHEDGFLDLEKAKSYYKKAVHLGNEKAMFMLGYMYLNPEDESFDSEEGIKYIEKSAQMGYSDANTFLGKIYRDGYCVKQDYSKAINYFSKGAQSFDLDAGIEFAKMILEGRGIERNRSQAFEIFEDIDDMLMDKDNAFYSMCLADAYCEYASNEKEISVCMKHYIKAYEGGIKRLEYNIMLLHELENIDFKNFNKDEFFYSDLLLNANKDTVNEYKIIEKIRALNYDGVNEEYVKKVFSLIERESKYPMLLFSFAVEVYINKEDARKYYKESVIKSGDIFSKGIFRRKYLYKK